MTQLPQITKEIIAVRIECKRKKDYNFKFKTEFNLKNKISAVLPIISQYKTVKYIKVQAI